MVADVLVALKSYILDDLDRFISVHGEVIDAVEGLAEGELYDKSVVEEHILYATNIMAYDKTPAPRRTNAGDGFEGFKDPVPSYKPLEDGGVVVPAHDAGGKSSGVTKDGGFKYEL